MTKQLGRTRFIPTAIFTMALIVACTAAQADVIVVTSTDGTTGGPDCTLRDAMTASNLDSPVGGCPHSGTPGVADTIELAPSELYVLSVRDNSAHGPNGLPFIDGDLTINGNGSVIERDPTAGAFRIIFVASRGILSLNDVTLRNGIAEGVSVNGLGGAIFNRGSIDLVNAVLVDNIAVQGGAIENTDSATLTGCTISHNTATFFRAGGIHNFDGTLAMRNCTVDDNSAPVEGGGIYHSFGLLTLVNTTVSGNMAGSRGGGLYADAPVSMANCTVSNNSAPMGGGIFSDGVSLLVETTDTIVADQNSGTDCAGSFVSGGFNLDSDGSCGFVGPGDISGGTANLGPLQNNGGPTDTHALLAGSEAIDAGSCAGGSVAVDQRGVARPIGNGCDIGAYEAECSRDGTCSGQGDCAADDSCLCDAGFAGPACAFSDEVTCHGHGTALDDGSCACQEGFAGASCDSCGENYFGFPECVFCTADVSCSSQGACDDTNGDCICDGGWTGAACDTDVDECAEQPCDPNATCTNEPGSFLCVCDDGFVGDGFVCEAQDDDRDGDGIPDDLDACPDENAAGVDADEDGCIDSPDGAISLIDESSEDEIAGQMKNSLIRKVEAAARQAQRGDICAAVRTLNALQNQIAAQRGKKISEETADLLTAYVENLIGQLLDELPEGETCG